MHTYAAILAAGLICPPFAAADAARETPTFRADVDMVVLTFTISDSRGKFIQNLTPADFQVLEDGVVQDLHSFTPPASVDPEAARVQAIPSSVFILMDSSNCMYQRFAYATDATTDFIRSLPAYTPAAVYGFSRNLHRPAPLTYDRAVLTNATRSGTSGDDTALYNALLLTVRDAAKQPGSKTIVVFSNGPDNASIVSPDDVARVAQEEGIPIHLISTRQDDAISTAAFERLTRNTGGRVHLAPDWTQQVSAFQAIRDELMNSYTVTYYARRGEDNRFRSITIDLKSDITKKLRIRARPGYRPHGNAPIYRRPETLRAEARSE